jgi:hypothetical protein
VGRENNADNSEGALYFAAPRLYTALTLSSQSIGCDILKSISSLFPYFLHNRTIIVFYAFTVLLRL